MSFDTIDLLSGNIFQITWDLGRRCNYDCSYCPAHRHDNFSPHASLDDLKSNTDFLFEYIDTYMQYRNNKLASISFTGGEPTVNPNFIPFVKYLNDEYYKKYSHKWDANIGLTTNGAMSEKMAEAVIENIQHVTVSYHTESDDKLRQQVKDRIKQFREAEIKYPKDFRMNVNVMFHAQQFDECKELCKWLDTLGCKYVPRVIGEEPDSKATFAHEYTPDQLDYIKNYWKYKNAKLNDEEEVSKVLSAAGEKKNEATKVLGSSIGRPCCGMREMCLSSAGGESRKSTFVNMREFKGWHCSVNWFFLHLEQQTDQVFHHQTCQARFDGTRGPIGKISEGKKIIADLKEKLSMNKMPTIVCPKQTCSCGLCAPKSKFKDSYKDTLQNHFNVEILDV